MLIPASILLSSTLHNFVHIGPDIVIDVRWCAYFAKKLLTTTEEITEDFNPDYWVPTL